MHVLRIDLLVQMRKELLAVNALGFLVPIQKPCYNFLVSTGLCIIELTRIILLFVKEVYLILDLGNLLQEILFCFVGDAVACFERHGLFVQVCE